MSQQDIRYSKVYGELYKSLNSEVEGYFDKNQLEKTGSQRLHFLAGFIFCIFLLSYAVFLLAGRYLPLLVISTFTLGLSAGILGAFGHEAIHRAFAKPAWLNNLMMCFQDLVGKSSYKYGLNHPKHHFYTNVDGYDPDLNVKPFLRLHPHQKRKFWHRFQHIYAVLVYSLAAFSTVYDFQNYFIYLTTKPLKHRLGYILGKISHLTFFLIIPILILGWQLAIVGYLIFMFTAGLYFATIIQPSHLFLGSEFDQPNQANILDEEWTARMIGVTSNYANGNWLLSMLYAGMDYHIIHQLFPHISMSHFPALNSILKKKVSELGLPYTEFVNLPQAIAYHLKYLQKLGQND